MGPYSKVTPVVFSDDERLARIEARLDALEQMTATLDDLVASVNKIGRYIKIAAPSIVSAAIAAGVVNGKFGAFLRALFGG